MDILSIALPAALALAADPITSLIDTGFVGHLGTFPVFVVRFDVSCLIATWVDLEDVIWFLLIDNLFEPHLLNHRENR